MMAAMTMVSLARHWCCSVLRLQRHCTLEDTHCDPERPALRLGLNVGLHGYHERAVLLWEFALAMAVNVCEARPIAQGLGFVPRFVDLPPELLVPWLLRRLLGERFRPHPRKVWLRALVLDAPHRWDRLSPRCG